MGLVSGLVLLAGVGVGTYSVAAGDSPSNGAFLQGRLSAAAAVACSGPVTPTVTAPGGLGGARSLGNVLWISAGVYRVDYPTPTWIEAKKPALLSRIVLRGWRCSDGRVLRFAPGPFKRPPMSSVVLASTGTLTKVVCPRALSHAISHGDNKPCVLGWYSMFSSPGKWVIQGQHGSKIIGTAVFDLHG